MANGIGRFFNTLAYGPAYANQMNRRDEAMGQLGQIGQDIETARNNPEQLQQYRDAQARMEALPQELRARLPEHARTLPTQIQGVGDAVRLLGIPTRLERMQYEYGDVPEVTQAMERYEGATRFNDPRALEGIQQYADENAKKNPATAGFMNLTADLGMGDLAYASGNELSQGRAKQAAGGNSVWELQGEIGGEELSAANSNLLDQYASTGTITDEEAAAWKVINQRRPYDVSEWMKTIAQTRGKAFAGIPGAVAQERALRPEKAATAASVEYAKLAPKEQLMELQSKARQQQKAGEAMVNWDKVVSLMGNMWGRKKEQLDEGVMGMTGSGPVVGALKSGAAKLRAPGGLRTGVFEGQRTETAMALNSVLTGQNRLIEGIFNRIAATLPDVYDTQDYAIAKIDQSIRNSYGLSKAMRQRGLLDPSYLQNFSDEQLADPESQINQEIASIAPASLDERDEREIQQIMNRILGADSPYRGRRQESQGGGQTGPATIRSLADEIFGE